MIKVVSNVVNGHAPGTRVGVEGTGIDVHREFHAVVLSTAKAILQASENVGGFEDRHCAKAILLMSMRLAIKEIEKM